MLDTLLAISFRHRSSLLLLLCWPVVAWSLRTDPVGGVATVLGVGVCALGVALRLLSVRRIGRGARVYRAHASGGLIGSGPYAWTRNPLYLAAGLMLQGLALLAGAGWASLLMPLATILVYTPVVVHEERALTPLLGPHYATYLASVPRWIGRGRWRGGAAPPPPVPWREVLRRENQLVPGLLLAAVAVWGASSGVLPLRTVLGAIGSPFGVGAGVVATLGFLAGAALNSGLVERKQRSRAKRRGAGADWDRAAARD